jgi:hypothetical protein
VTPLKAGAVVKLNPVPEGNPADGGVDGGVGVDIVDPVEGAELAGADEVVVVVVGADEVVGGVDVVLTAVVAVVDVAAAD